jgi:hypothetical protein
MEWDDNIPKFEVSAATAGEARERCESALAAAATQQSAVERDQSQFRRTR